VAATSACLTEDELLDLGAGSLADAPAAEAHLAECSTCSALLASVVRAPRAWDALAGSTIGPYRVDAQIGAGAMGAVYRAWDPKLSRAVALKVLHHGSGVLDEARAAAAIDHRAVVAIYDVGTADDLAYVAMELVDGETLRGVLKRGGVGVARARELMRELADGLAAAHARGVVHRDLKPDNLVVARDGLRILDFGLAATGGGAAGAVGTPGYMAPEQTRGEPADARADLFAAGAIGYELATGRRAFPGANASERLAAGLRDTPPLDELGLLAPIVARCLAKDPRDRFQSAADLAWALRAQVAAPARLSRRAIVVAGAGALATGIVGFALGRRRTSRDLAVRPLSHRSGRIYTARFTPDATRIIYGAAWDDDPVRVFELDLASGETMPLDLPSADVLAVSRDDLAISVGRAYIDHECARGRLAIMRLAGGELRPLADDVQEADFATPGALAAVRPNGSGFRIELPTGTSLVEHTGWISNVRVSPDGTRIAYAQHPQTDDDGGELVVVEIATRASRELSRGWISLAGLVWEPSGDSLVFSGSRTNASTTLHRVTLDGDETALPSPAADRVRLHDVSDRGTLVTLDQLSQRVIVGDRDASLSDGAYVVDISADGSQVVIGEYGGVAAGPGTYLVPYAGGRVLRLARGFPAAISPSGERVAVNLPGQRLVVYSTRSGETLPMAAPDFILRARWIDERTLVAAIHDSLWRLSLDAPPVRIADGGGRIALDPERRRCAYVDYAGALHVFDIATSTTRIIARGLTQHSVGGWLADPDAILVRWTGVPIRLDRYDPITGEHTPFREIQPPRLGLKAIDNFVMHKGGERFAYSFGHELGVLALVSA
jgi:hypothetical protein